MNNYVWLLLAFCLAGALAAPKPSRLENKLRIKAPSRKSLLKASRLDANRFTPIGVPQLEINMGTPAQTIFLDIDTTSGDTFVIDENAQQINKTSWQYRASASKSLKISNYQYSNETFDVEGLRVRVSGNVSTDVVEFNKGDFSLRFALIDKIVAIDEGATFPSIFQAGQVGFGFQSSGNLGRFMEQLFLTTPSSQKTLTTIIYECMDDDEDEVIFSDITIGSIDEELCNVNTTVKTPLTDGIHWGFYVAGYTYATKHSSTRQQAILNSRDLLTGVPADLYDYVFKMLNATNDPRYAWPIVNCDQRFHALIVKTDGDEFEITPEQYIFTDFDNGPMPCHLMLYPLSGGGFKPTWSFGYIWMYQKCVTFDYGQRQLLFTDFNKGHCDNL